MGRISNETQLVLRLAGERVAREMRDKQALCLNTEASTARRDGFRSGVDTYARILNEIVDDLRKVK